MDSYLQHLQQDRASLPSQVRHLVADGYYSKTRYIQDVMALGLHQIGKLRNDASLRWLYRGEQKRRERNKMRQMTRLLYSWRYIDHARAEAGEPIPDHHQGFNLLTPSTPDKIRSTYTVAINTPMHWQVIVVGYIHDDEDEYRNWAWVKKASVLS